MSQPTRTRIRMKLNSFPIRKILLTTGIAFLPLMAHGAGGDTWTRKANMPTPRSGLSTCVVNEKIYAIGGAAVGGFDSLASVEAYDPATDSWVSKTPLPDSRAWFAAAVVNGKIYVIGGDRTWLSSPLNIVEEYDPAMDTWTRKADMPTARSGIAAGVVDGKIYVVGGLTTLGAPNLSTVEAYDPATDTWERKAAMSTRRGAPCAAVVDGKIFVIGSTLPPSGPWLRTAERYDPQTDTWTPVASTSIARGALTGVTAHGRIYVMGGRDCCTGYAIVEEYDPVKNTWTKRAAIGSTSPRVASTPIALATSEVNGRIYAIGGQSDPSNTQGSSLVLEYTPPITPPVLHMNLMKNASQSVLRLEWTSRSDCFDLLQRQDQLQPSGWTDVERFTGTVETLSKEIPTTEPAVFYRLQRELN
jgi:N-acetylneuraminic acid mutarotase